MVGVAVADEGVVDSRGPVRRFLSNAGQKVKAVAVATGRVVGEIAEGAAQMVYERECLNEAVRRHGWPSTNVLALDLTTVLVEAIEGVEPEREGEALAAAFVEHLGAGYWAEARKEWHNNRALQGRLEIVEQALDAYLGGMYALPAPTLYAQMEGLLGWAFHHQGRMNGRRVTEYLELVAHFAPHLKGDVAILDVWKGRTVQTVAWGSEIPSDISRHAIVHGIDTTYGTQVKALKVLMLFDFVQRAVSSGFVLSNETAHHAGCERIDCDAPDLEFLRNPFVATLRFNKESFYGCRDCGTGQEEEDAVDTEFVTAQEALPAA